jgi:hypothetical protein
MQTSLDIGRATQVTDKAIIANEKAKVAAMNQVGLAYGFNNAQQATFTSLVNAGTAADIAAEAVKSGLTTTIYNEMVAKVAATGATGEEAKAKLADMVATY